jgi:hypothetical protein
MTSYSDHVRELSRLLMGKQQAIRENEAYYESNYRPKAVGVSVPPEMRRLLAQVGWPRVYLDSIEERLDIEGFRMRGSDQSDERVRHWWQANGLDEKSGLGHLEAFKHGAAYITVSAPDENDSTRDPDVPIFHVESPKHMYADIDSITGKVTRALRLHRSPGSSIDDRATLLLPNETVFLNKGTGYDPWTVDRKIEHNLGAVLVQPLVNRRGITEPLGSSEIVTELRTITDAAARTMMNMQAAAELMAVPQRLLFGVAREALQANPNDPGSVLEAYFARIIAIEDVDASATQFAAADLRNFVDVLQELSKQAAAYTGLPPQYMTVASDNPASAEAIKSSESRLVKKAERKHRGFGSDWENAIRLGMLVIDRKIPKEAHTIETMWRDPSTPTFASKADAVVKLATAVTPDGRAILPVEQARIDLGYGSETRKNLEKWDNQSATAQIASLLNPGKPEPKPEAKDAA